ncbi:acyltransferase family protein [Acinetobacter sp. VNH17]|uniref:Acyltransferase family protein n=1 Tax=Acinetobacter thutiue TaxID=2998078 RepID=A0ABT7WPB2_9GAMM|nr:acyltransferase family protein [Acinetobacter thutiue]MCY6412404.1 acyltransferase family protein [Acinetobacter thutiue]MDN0014508.1 acyltransferase family protein [Acinetobacter thutiue]
MKKEYLPHIDILRTIAVFLVIFNHLNITLFSGGFIGVDIFFVISGYLITKNIQQEIQQNNFSLLVFYQRRVKRLAPAFFTVLTCCTLVFLQFSTPFELYAYFKSLIAATILSSNIYFWQSLNDYFSIDAHTTPLLHIWSLSLEEQFYLIWPVLLLFTIKLKFRIRLILFFLIFISSFLCSYYSANYNAIFAYYLLPTRFFEFMLGAFLIALPQRNFSTGIIISLTTFSLSILFIFSFVLTKDSTFPSYNALFVCCASAIYIYFSRIDEQKQIWQPILYLGKISYPMYLWHWPIIVAINVNSIALDTKVRIIVIITTIILSWLTYEKIEKPVKIYIKNHNDILKILFLIPSLVIIFISIIMVGFNRFQINTSRQPSPKQNSYECLDSGNNNLACLLGLKQSNTIDLLFVGDSHANAQSPIIDIFAKDMNISGYEFTQSTTIFLPDTNCIRTDKGSKNKDFYNNRFRNRNDLIQKTIKKNHYRFVVMGGYFTMDYCIYSNENQKNSSKAFNEGLERAINIIIKSGATPVIIQDNPQLHNININCNLRTNSPEKSCRYESNIHFITTKNWNNQLIYLKKKYPKLIIIDFNDIICPNNFCYSYINNIPLYRDSHHLTHEGAYEIGKRYLKIHGNPLKSYE